MFPLTLFIWGMIIYKIFFHTSTPEESLAFVQNTTIKKNASALPDTFELRLNYADPFLKNEKRVIPVNTQTTKKKVEAKPQKNTEVVNFPAIKYGGLIKKEGHELAIVSINGFSNFIKAGETVCDIKLIQVCNDSIIVCFQNQKRTIKK